MKSSPGTSPGKLKVSDFFDFSNFFWIFLKSSKNTKLEIFGVQKVDVYRMPLLDGVWKKLYFVKRASKLDQ